MYTTCFNIGKTILFYLSNKCTIFVNNSSFLKHFYVFSKQIFLIYIVHVLDKCNKILHNARYVHHDYEILYFVPPRTFVFPIIL